MTPSGLKPVRVWDLPTRLFHWALFVSVVALVISGQVGGNALVWHMRIGLVVLALLGFRLVWGLVGGRWSRFASFLYAPGTVLRYLRGQARPGEWLDVGHNPLGSFSVFALLALLVVQVATGLVADDEIATTGPLNRYVSTALGLQATWWHADVGKVLLMVLVLLHIGAIVYYRLRKGHDLVTPMIRGDKPLPPEVPASVDSAGTRVLAAVLLALWAAVAVWVARLGG
jgi:cytochrome b